MPTLLSVNNYFYRRDGSEAVFMGQNEMLAEVGWRVVPFAMHHPENAPSPWSEYFVEDIEYGQRYSLGQKVRRVPKVIYSLEAKRKAEAIVARARPNLVHCHSVYHHLSPSVLSVFRRRGLPIVMTLHDMKVACPAYHMFRGSGPCEECKGGRLHRVVVNRCIKGSAALSAIVMVEAVVHRMLKTYERAVDRFVVPSRFYVEKLAEWGFDPRRFVHIPNFVNCAAIRPAETTGSDFLYCGRLAPEKGISTLLRAAAKARVRVGLAGAGPERQALEREAAQVGATAVFLGRLDAPALQEALRSARAVVVPSECYENAPIAVLEAFAAGRPVIGARIGGIPELIDEGRTGWLFPSGNADALAEVLRGAAVTRSATVDAMGRAARADAEALYDRGRYRDSMLALYRGLGVAGDGRRSA